MKKWLAPILGIVALAALGCADENISLLRKAEAGDAEAQHLLGTRYANGEGVAQDYEEAAKWYRMAAEQSYSAAQFELGVMYVFGEGVPTDKAEGMKWIRRASEHANRDALFLIGFILYSSTDAIASCAEGIRRIRKEAERGHAPSQYWLGLESLGWFPDSEKGINLFTRATPAKSPEWLRNASKFTRDAFSTFARGNLEAEEKLRVFTEDEMKLFARTNVLFHLYTEHDFKNLIEVRDTDPKGGVAWLRKAGDQGFVPAQLALGECYRYGAGVLKDEEEAVKWYRMAAEQGDTSAQHALGLLYSDDKAAIKDLVKAHAWLNISHIDEFKGTVLTDIEKQMSAEQKADAMKLARGMFEKIKVNEEKSRRNIFKTLLQRK